uniref:Uncharacterized protein n=1 Tax=Mycobacterium riyadhense TaxID=486698 RepID=A0A653F161_9MYCO|nr:hypothetical protein BIN_B_05108 [Mycobacterium riyadhense]
MFPLAYPEKPRPQRDLGCQVERVTRLLRYRLVQLRFRPAAGIDDLPADICLLGRHDHLLGYPFNGRNDGAQALMAAHHIGHRRRQRNRIKLPTQLQRPHHVVDR